MAKRTTRRCVGKGGKRLKLSSCCPRRCKARKKSRKRRRR
jgi:hypothetical protein